MEVLFVALPVALLLGAAAVAAFIIAARHGQFDDLDTPPQRMLYDDLEIVPPSPPPPTTSTPEPAVDGSAAPADPPGDSNPETHQP
jgi:cbb3-type cytochrome oxidase maturation protein